jgi:23S rRNA (uracil1939-C5)-methyltransferase
MSRHPATVTLRIDRLGDRGDGVADHDGRSLHVAGALAGELVSVDLAGERGVLGAVLEPSPDRAVPVCPLFGSCGGCATQHLAPASYAVWKRGLVEEALRRVQLSPPIAPVVDAHGAGRRRVTLHVRRKEGGLFAGFMRARSHELIAIPACPVLAPALARAPEVAMEVGRLVLARGDKPLDVQITASAAGLDVDLRGSGPPSDSLRARLVAIADALDLARLSVHGDIVVQRRSPAHIMGPAAVVPPPGGFLQATDAGEAVLGGLVIEATTGAGRVADLFAGCGPFALRLAAQAEVVAVESERKALVALDRAARATPGLKAIRCEVRDLFRRPLLPSELAAFDAVVLDPPRAGADAQVRQLAASAVSRVVYVSCDPGSFARDARSLVDGGYALSAVTPVDQFRYAHHVELVGVFEKASVRRPKGGKRGILR